MRALVKAEAAPGLGLIDVPEPTAGPAEVKIAVLRAAIRVQLSPPPVLSGDFGVEW